MKSSLVGALVSTVMMLVLTLGFCALAYTREDPDSLAGVLSFAALYITALLAGMISAKRCGKNAPACGALGGFILLIFLCVISLFCDSAGYSVGVGLALKASVIFVSVLGAVIAAQKGDPRRRKRKRS